MSIASYLPSAQFSVIITSVLLAGGLIWAADHYTSPTPVPRIAPADIPSAITTNGLDWKATLAAIQGEDTLPTPPSEEVVDSLLAAAETPNITDSIGRTILVNLSEAKAQGLGGDVLTQERIVADAAARIAAGKEATLYTSAELTVVSDSSASLIAYGNGVISVLATYPKANVEDTLVALGNTADTGKAISLASLQEIATAYEGITTGLLALPVPQTLAPLHLQVVNNFSLITATYADMQVVLTDPLRGLAGLKLYRSLTDETIRLFINIAQALDKNGILFSENEPGHAWSLLVAP